MNNDCYEPVCEKDDPLSSMRKLVDRVKRQDFDDDIEPPKEECPIGREILGYFTWSFLHTMSIYYPERPTEE
jgi:FAD-linked sulfhydryl oxidase